MGSSIPLLCHHKASGRAVVRLDGRDFYLGPWRSAQARQEYDRLIAQWLAAGRSCPAASHEQRLVAEVIAAFWEHAQVYYRHPDGSPTNELKNFRDALRPLRRLYGHTPVSQFGPLALKAVRQVMIAQGLCRTSINRRINRLRQVFKWAAENELIPPAVHQALQSVAGLKRGRCEAKEAPPVRPVSQADVEAILPHVSRQVAAMIRLQRLTGMRSGEIVIMRGMDLETQGELWAYRPPQHKTSHLGHDRCIFLGPKAQEILGPFLKGDAQAYLFSPAEAEAHRRAQRAAQRRTPISCGNKPGSHIKLHPRKKPGSRYSVQGYARAIQSGCDAAFSLPEHLGPRLLESGKRETQKAWRQRLTDEEKQAIRVYRKAHRWHPHQLRHSAATDLRKAYGLETAQVILGHKTLTVTQLYAEKNAAMAMRIMSEVG